MIIHTFNNNLSKNHISHAIYGYIVIGRVNFVHVVLYLNIYIYVVVYLKYLY